MRPKSSQKGSTLIEALVAMAIFAAGASATFSMLMLSLVTARANALDTHAVALATQEREDLRSLVYANIVSRDPYTSASPDVFGGAKFTVHSEVQNDQPAANMKTVTVTVSWNYKGAPRSYSLSTIYTNVNG
jgi:prepilin-type N-terminal cleavage/methylation domain-containing protein